MFNLSKLLENIYHKYLDKKFTMEQELKKQKIIDHVCYVFGKKHSDWGQKEYNYYMKELIKSGKKNEFNNLK